MYSTSADGLANSEQRYVLFFVISGVPKH